MTNRPNRGWRIRANTARAVIHRSQEPLEITMSLETEADGKQVLTMRAGPTQQSSPNAAVAVATYRFAQGKGRASTIEEMAGSLSPHEVAAMLGVNEGITAHAADPGTVARYYQQSQD